jgi:hypothetical protein
LYKLQRRARDERGQTYAAPVGALLAIAVLAMLVVSAFSLGSHAAPLTPRRTAEAAVENSAKALLQRAQSTAALIAASDHGSFARVGKLELYKVGRVRSTPSTTVPYVSAAVGQAHSYSITVTAGDGATFTAHYPAAKRLRHHD